jgi:hypothetical protein
MFDGATRLGELFVFIARFVPTDLVPVQRIFALETTRYSVNGAALAGLLQMKLQEKLGITSDNISRLVAMMHDSASVNSRGTSDFVCFWLASACASACRLFAPFQA